MNCHIRSLYVCVTNMDRAIKFYEHFFEMPVLIRDDIYSIFDINGFRFGLFAFENMQEKHSYGNNCLPSIDVENLEELQHKISGLKIVFPVKKIGTNWVCEYEDSEGNHIELTAPIMPVY